MNARAARAGSSVLHSPRPVPPKTARTAKPSLAVVPESSPRSGRAGFVMLLVLVLSGGLAALLGFNTALAQGSFTAGKLQKQATELDDRSQSLEEDLARAAAPEKLAQQARKIGMVPAPGVAFIQLGDGTVTGGAVPAPAAPRILTPEEKAAQAAQAELDAQKARQEKQEEKVRKALRQEEKAAAAQRKADEQAAAAQAAAEAQAQAEWQQKLKEQENAGPRSGGEQIVDPPPGR